MLFRSLQHLQEMLPGRTTKVESLHKIIMTAIGYHQVRNTILKDSEAIKIHLRRPRSPKFCRAKVINLRLIKAGEKGYSFIRRVRDGGRTAAHLKLGKG